MLVFHLQNVSSRHYCNVLDHSVHPEIPFVTTICVALVYVKRRVSNGY